MKAIFRYVVFNDSKQFVNWQTANPQFSIYQMTPIMTNGAVKEGGSDEIDVSVKFSIFVVYAESNDE